jgi:biotin carboxyl carrier protein
MLELLVNDKFSFSVAEDNGQMLLNGSPADWDASLLPNGLISVLYNGKCFTAIVESINRDTKMVSLRVNGQLYKTAIKEPIDLLLRNLGMDKGVALKVDAVKAPMPGMVLKIMVTTGQKINKGDVLVILEAMKMENILKATADAVVKSINVSEHTAVEKGTVLIELQ